MLPIWLFVTVIVYVTGWHYKISKIKIFHQRNKHLNRKKTRQGKTEAAKRQTTIYRTQIAIAGLEEHNPRLMRRPINVFWVERYELCGQSIVWRTVSGHHQQKSANNHTSSIHQLPASHTHKCILCTHIEATKQSKIDNFFWDFNVFRTSLRSSYWCLALSLLNKSITACET